MYLRAYPSGFFPSFSIEKTEILCYTEYMNERFLPIGIQDFEDLRTRKCIYVDKTDFIYKLSYEGKPYFLSRPRRFGKSLLLSTMEYYFLGRKDLFTGLALEKLEENSDNPWTKYPVLKISFGLGSYEDNEKLVSMMDYILKQNEEKYGIEKNSDNPATRLSELISKLYKKTGKKVVILIDEYDKPILDAL